MTGVFSPGQSVALYVNGEKVAVETTSIPTEVSLTDLFKIGAQADASSGFWDGQIDEVRVIAHALSQAEIQDLMDPDEVYSQTEQTTSTKYYFAGGRLAMRTNGTLNYLLSDHLGSTSVTADANGDFLSEVRYMPWGETGYMSGTVGTDYLYTGQRRDAYIKLIHMGTSWHDPYVNQSVWIFRRMVCFSML